jgi:hypothetical protein
MSPSNTSRVFPDPEVLQTKLKVNDKKPHEDKIMQTSTCFFSAQTSHLQLGNLKGGYEIVDLVIHPDTLGFEAFGEIQKRSDS